MSVAVGDYGQTVRHRGLAVFDRDIRAAKAATMIRKGASIQQVCAALPISRSNLRDLASDYGFALPSPPSKVWPAKDEKGIADVSARDRNPTRQEITTRAAKAARAQRLALGAEPPAVKQEAPQEAWPDIPPPAPYDICPAAPERRKSSSDIIRHVCAKYGISRELIVGPTRARPIVIARQEAAFRMIVELGLSYPQAGRRLGNRDHTTMLHAVRRHAQRNPEAMEAYQQFVEANAIENEAKRKRVVAMYRAGRQITEICREVDVSRFKAMGWVVETSDDGRKAA